MKAIRLCEVGYLQAFRLTKNAKVWFHLSIFGIENHSFILVKNALVKNCYKLLAPDTIVYVRDDK